MVGLTGVHIFGIIDAVAMDPLHHFSHEHPLSLVHLQKPNHKIENDDDEDEDEGEDENENEVDFVEEDQHGGQCNLCNEQIWSFHLCYYSCKSCDYSLHKFCAELPKTLQNHPSHPAHELQFISRHNIKFFDVEKYHYVCHVCNLHIHRGHRESAYFCQFCPSFSCDYVMDIICAVMSKQKINHPSHPHQLERVSRHKNILDCVACGTKHEGVFFLCTTCPRFRINLDCALLPAKLLIQNHTDGAFTHSHPLTLSYSFPYSEIKAKFYPRCRVCGDWFYSHLWIYKCDKCRYYVHVDCATSRREPFMSIFLRGGLGKTSKNFKEDEHPNLLHLPFDDEGDNLLKRHQKGKQHDGEMLNHSIHQHPLVLFDNQTTVDKRSISLHDPMKRTQLLCDGCVKPIMTVPFYTCCQYEDKQCCFVLHEWCATLPLEIRDYMGHPEHTLSLLPKVPADKFFGVFKCDVCRLPSNGFAYGCETCEYYIDINCAFIPEEITHDSHPNHLLSKVNPSTAMYNCKACRYWRYDRWGFQCPSCDFFIHVECALLLPRVIKHKCDKHPLSLRYEPAENHMSEYFCEICEDELNPWLWFYHCTACAQSMHTACVPLIIQCEQAPYRDFQKRGVYKFLNVKFGGTLEIRDHSHRLAFVQGLESDGNCSKCGWRLQYEMIFKCLECKFAFHYECV